MSSHKDMETSSTKQLNNFSHCLGSDNDIIFDRPAGYIQDKSDQTSAELVDELTDQKLSEAVIEPLNNIFDNSISDELLIAKCNAYSRPEIAKMLMVPQLNGWLDKLINEEQKENDKKLQKMQGYMIATMSAVATQAQNCLCLKQWAMNSSHTEISEKLPTFAKAYASMMDANLFMTRIMHDINQFRRNLIKEQMKNSLLQLFLEENKPTPDWLVGKDISIAMENDMKNTANSQVENCQKHSKNVIPDREIKHERLSPTTSKHSIYTRAKSSQEVGESILSDSDTTMEYQPTSPENDCDNVTNAISDDSALVCSETNHPFNANQNTYPTELSNINKTVSAQAEEVTCRCPHCDSILIHLSNLFQTGNIKTETGARLHMCSSCGKDFNCEVELVNSNRLHLSDQSSECEKELHSASSFLDVNTQLSKQSCTSSSVKLLANKLIESHQCSKCGKRFHKDSSLKKHMKIHRDQKPYPCSMCTKEFSKAKTLDTHMKIHTGEISFSCSICSKNFSSAGSLKVHMANHTGDLPHKCLECEKTFPTANSLKLHSSVHSGEKSYACSECGKTFSTPGSCKVHMRTHTGDMPCRCPECGRGFHCSSNLKIHMRAHSGERPFICSICEKTFIASQSLKTHMQTHTGVKPFPCSTCKRAFTTNSSLRTHMRTHTGEKAHLCIECGKRFRAFGNLEIHMRMHTGERPFKCPHCSSAFGHSSHLKKHIRTHTGERPFLCKECGKRFLCGSYLTSHMRTHSGEKPYVCSDCGKGFRLPNALKLHHRTHTGIKPHPCPECDKHFNTRWHVKEHMRTHTGDKPYHCTECDKRFGDAGSLKKHTRIHLRKKNLPSSLI